MSKDLFLKQEEFKKYLAKAFSLFPNDNTEIFKALYDCKYKHKILKAINSILDGTEGISVYLSFYKVGFAEIIIKSDKTTSSLIEEDFQCKMEEIVDSNTDIMLFNNGIDSFRYINNEEEFEEVKNLYELIKVELN